VLICYEVIFPELARECVANNAGLLVNITNDAWFGNTGAPYQHFSMAVFRAVENRRSLIRSANTGISGFIDPAGKLLSQSGLFEEAVMTHSVPVIKKYTSIYTRYGNLLVLGCFIVLAFIIMIKSAGQVFRKKAEEIK
jgi:apolipoprotein N-acyltransferase